MLAYQTYTLEIYEYFPELTPPLYVVFDNRRLFTKGNANFVEIIVHFVTKSELIISPNIIGYFRMTKWGLKI